MAQIGQLLLERRWITAEQLEEALRRQRDLGGRLGTALLEIDAISEELLTKALAEQLEVPLAGVDDLRNVPEEVYSLLPAKLAQRHLAVPFRSGSRHLDLATLKVRDLAAIDELSFVLGQRLVIHIANEARIFGALEHYYGRECPVRMRNLLDRLDRDRDQGRPAQAAPAESPPAPEPAAGSAATVARPAERRVRRPAAEASRTGATATAAPAPSVSSPPTPAAAPASAPPPKRSVPLTDAERQALRSSRRGAPDEHTGPRPRAETLTLDEVEERLAVAEKTSQVGAILLDYLSQEFLRTVLFRVQDGRVRGWMGRGPALDYARLEGYSVGLDEPSLFLNLQRGGEFFVGALPEMPAHVRLAACWDGELGHECALLPIRLRGHLVSVVYGDRDAIGLRGLDIRMLQRLVAKAAIAFEMCIMRKKLHRA